MPLKNIPKIHKVGNKYRIQTMINGKRYSAEYCSHNSFLSQFHCQNFAAVRINNVEHVGF